MKKLRGLMNSQKYKKIRKESISVSRSVGKKKKRKEVVEKRKEKKQNKIKFVVVSWGGRSEGEKDEKDER